MIALTIAAREALCMRRADVLRRGRRLGPPRRGRPEPGAMLPVVSRALSEFVSALDRAGRRRPGDDVHRVGLRAHVELERPRIGPRVGREPHGHGRCRGRGRHLRPRSPTSTSGSALGHRARAADPDDLGGRVLRDRWRSGSACPRRTSSSSSRTSAGSTTRDRPPLPSGSWPGWKGPSRPGRGAHPGRCPVRADAASRGGSRAPTARRPSEGTRLTIERGVEGAASTRGRRRGRDDA